MPTEKVSTRTSRELCCQSCKGLPLNTLLNHGWKATVIWNG
jgi:hypothetical protein